MAKTIGEDKIAVAEMVGEVVSRVALEALKVGWGRTRM